MVEASGPRLPLAPPTHPAHSLLLRSHDAATAQEIYTTSILHRPLPIKPRTRSPSRTQPQTNPRRPKHPKKKVLSARRKRTLGLHDLPAQVRYRDFLPLHRLWTGYVREVLGTVARTDVGQIGATLASADWHGARVEVVRCGCVGRVGLGGIVLREGRGVFVIVTKGNQMKSKSEWATRERDGVVYALGVVLLDAYADAAIALPKEDTIFRVEIPTVEGLKEDLEGWTKKEGDGTIVVELHGSQFQVRPTERGAKKFKPHISPNI